MNEIKDSNGTLNLMLNKNKLKETIKMNELEKKRLLEKLESPASSEALKELLIYLKHLRKEVEWVESVFGAVIFNLGKDGSKESLEEIGRLAVEVSRQN